MRHEQFAKRRFTIVLTAVVIGMLGASGLAWKNPLKGSVSQWRTAEHLR